MLDHSTPVFASIDITFVNSKPWLKVAFKGRVNILLFALFTTYEIYTLSLLQVRSPLTLYVLPVTVQVNSSLKTM